MVTIRATITTTITSPSETPSQHHPRTRTRTPLTKYYVLGAALHSLNDGDAREDVLEGTGYVGR